MRTTPRILIRAIQKIPEQQAIQVDFNDGSCGLFPYVWLRDCSLDPKTYTISNAMKGRLHFMRDFDVKVEPVDIQLDQKENCLHVHWPNKVHSRFDQRWLKNRCIGQAQVRQQRRQIYLDREIVQLWDKYKIEQKLRRFPQKEFFADDKILHNFLTEVCVNGIAVLEAENEGAQKGNGDGKEVLGRIVKRIGILQRNHFGETFEVFPKPDASNMAYAGAQELPYHTDFPSLQDPPQLQLLHMCHRAECGGGLSMFVDGFNVAEQLARLQPELFSLLSSIPLEFIEEGYDVHTLMDGSQERFDFDMVSRHKTFKLDDRGRVVKVQFGNVMRSWFIDLADPLLVQQIYDGLKLFTELCYSKDNQLVFPLQNGDTVLWANTRLLHARSAYKLVGNPARERHVVGCYFAWDVVKSRIRLLRDQLNLPENQPSL